MSSPPGESSVAAVPSTSQTSTSASAASTAATARPLPLAGAAAADVPPCCYKPRPVSPSRPLDGSMHFNMSTYPRELLESLNVLRSHSKLCDICLRCDNDGGGSDCLYAHKVVLAAASPYFRAMFTSGYSESERGEITLREVSADTLCVLVEFAYTSELHVSEMNVCRLLPAAAMLQMSHVVDACCMFLEQQLDPCNAIGVADFAQQHGCNDLYRKTQDYINRHFTEISKRDEFLQLSCNQLIRLIHRDELNVACESEVYQACLGWVRHGGPHRTGKLEHLLGAVRCHYLTPGFIETQLHSCPILNSAPACRDYLTRIFQDLTLHKRCRVKMRRPNSPLVIYSVGGYLRHSLTNVECYHPAHRKWYPLRDLGMPRSGVGAAQVHGMIYVVGGRNNCPDGNVDCANVDCYNPHTNQWSAAGPGGHRAMQVARNRVGVGVLDNMLYAVGGSYGAEHHSSVERYDPEKDTWTYVKSMHHQRIGVGVTVVNRLMYAVGGYDGVNRLSSCERYYPETDTWELLPSMNTTRSGAGVCSVGGHIYAVGGYDGSSQLRSVERLSTDADPSHTHWEFVAPMIYPRSALGIAVLNNNIYALGGYDGREFLSSVEVYDVDSGQWSELTEMSCGRSGHGVVVWSQPPCIDFTT